MLIIHYFKTAAVILPAECEASRRGKVRAYVNLICSQNTAFSRIICPDTLALPMLQSHGHSINLSDSTSTPVHETPEFASLNARIFATAFIKFCPAVGFQ